MPSSAATPRADILAFLSQHYHPTNKIPGLVAELDFAAHLDTMGFGDRLVRGGWIVEPESPQFYQDRVALFPAPFGSSNAVPATPVITAAQYLRGAGMRTLYCVPISVNGTSVEWKAAEMSGPSVGEPSPLVDWFAGFPPRRRAYVKRTPNANVAPIANVDRVELDVLFARESMLDVIRADHLVTANDLDYLVWGRRATYPVEIKEKTVAGLGRVRAGQNRAQRPDAIGPWLGLDIGPFSKLACFAAAGAGQDSLFVVREIEDRVSRRHKAWHMIRFSELCRSCSWVFQGGGTNMLGGASAVVKVPLRAFQPLDREHLEAL